jgi:NADH pyrophosphatase NudC (nudix superfamily)
VLAVKRGPQAHGANGLYAMPAGYLDMSKVDDGNGGMQYETLEMGVAREAYEEAGVIIPIDKIRQFSVNSYNKDINVCFTAVLDGTIDMYRPNTSNCEPGEIDDARWINLRDIDKIHWAYNQEKKIPAIARTVLPDQTINSGDISRIEAMLRHEIGNNQRAIRLLDALIDKINRAAK